MSGTTGPGSGTAGWTGASGTAGVVGISGRGGDLEHAHDDVPLSWRWAASSTSTRRLVAPLVLADAAGGGLVGVGQPLGDVARGEVVVAAERLVLLQALGAVDHRRALAVRALVGDTSLSWAWVNSVSLPTTSLAVSFS